MPAMPPRAAVRVLVVGAWPGGPETAARALRGAGYAASAANTAAEALARFGRDQPDVVLAAPDAVGGTVAGFIGELIRRNAAVAAVALAPPGGADALAAIRAGAAGAVGPVALPRLAGVVAAAAAGEVVLPPALAGAVLACCRRLAAEGDGAGPQLSAEEATALELRAAGAEPGSIAKRMNSSAVTARRRLRTGARKLQLHCRADMVGAREGAAAIREG